jgi:hypothetical protein
MQRRAFKPCLVAWREVEINYGGKTEGKIRAGNRGSIGSREFWMGVDCAFIERRGVTRMHV